MGSCLRKDTLFKAKIDKIDTLFKTKNPEKHTLVGRTSPLSPYKGVPPPRDTKTDSMYSTPCCQLFFDFTTRRTTRGGRGLGI